MDINTLILAFREIAKRLGDFAFSQGIRGVIKRGEFTLNNLSLAGYTSERVSEDQGKATLSPRISVVRKQKNPAI